MVLAGVCIAIALAQVSLSVLVCRPGNILFKLAYNELNRVLFVIHKGYLCKYGNSLIGFSIIYL